MRDRWSSSNVGLKLSYFPHQRIYCTRKKGQIRCSDPLDPVRGIKLIALNDWLALSMSSEIEDAVIGF